ncbi:unnamed protein product [Darwinula stevensoni]|uniref:Sphingomyelin phosphodiesterase C-terminal domain-containing protein n=1 Tax=Darwinula stevensoni TaxID=69355 RepID=A0A7R8X9E8_9CRUS|nr:unnamed protein product [Darwinula stevensoni]CAG0884462.1 unnamed protein product [Darwinula stevensoni]
MDPRDSSSSTHAIPLRTRFPPDAIPKEDFSVDWLYEALWDLWKDWLPADQKENVLHGGYYSVLARPGLRIIAINNNFCYAFNWFVWMDIPDPNDHLSWLVKELQQSELAGEKVWIIGHIPPGSTECLPTWSYNYRRIINRYESTVTGQFFGHTHMEEYNVFFDEERPERAMVLDHETWVFNLDEANAAGEISWYLLYKAKETFGLPDLSPKSWASLTWRMTEDDVLFQHFHRIHVSNSSSSSPIVSRCNEECKRLRLCFLFRADSSDTTQCKLISNAVFR